MFVDCWHFTFLNNLLVDGLFARGSETSLA
jgi:hypothetical protein